MNYEVFDTEVFKDDTLYQLATGVLGLNDETVIVTGVS